MRDVGTKARVKAPAILNCRCTNHSYGSEWGSRYRGVDTTGNMAGSSPPCGKTSVFAGLLSRLRGGTFSHPGISQRVLLLQANLGCCADEVILRIMEECSVGVQVA